MVIYDNEYQNILMQLSLFNIGDLIWLKSLN